LIFTILATSVGVVEIRRCRRRAAAAAAAAGTGSGVDGNVYSDMLWRFVADMIATIGTWFLSITIQS